MSQASVATHLKCGGIFSDSIIRLQMFCWFKQWKRLENRSIYDAVKAYEVKAYKKCASFFGPPCTWSYDVNMCYENFTLPSSATHQRYPVTSSVCPKWFTVLWHACRWRKHVDSDSSWWRDRRLVVAVSSVGCWSGCSGCCHPSRCHHRPYFYHMQTPPQELTKVGW